MKRTISTKDGDTPVTFVLDKIIYFELQDDIIVFSLLGNEDYTVDCGSAKNAKKLYNDVRQALDGNQTLED